MTGVDDEKPGIWYFGIDDDSGEVLDAWKAEDDPGLGGCRMCGKQGPKARNAVCMDFTAPELGTGWGCVVCNLPADGAVTVLCDDCLEGWQGDYIEIERVCKGYPANGESIGIDEYTHRPFQHDFSYHENE